MHGLASGTLLPPLRPYQQAVANAVLASIAAGRGHSFSVLIARQGGKNELSARIELLLLVAKQGQAVEAIKCAPTFAPQARISLRRLWQRLRAAGLASPQGPAVLEDGAAVRLGQARQRFLSAQPGAAVAGHTAHALLEVDEAQDVDADQFDHQFKPMAATTNATTVFYGTAWDSDSLLAQAIARHRELERRDDVRRHFEADWQEVARYNPAYGRYVAGERARLGEEHPLFQTQYLLRMLPGSGRLFSPAALALLQGRHPRLVDPTPAERGYWYVGGLDVGGEALPGSGRDADSTVLTIARVRPAPAAALIDEPQLEIVQHYAWQGAGQPQLAPAIARLVREQWRLRRLAVDATGVGEGLAAALAGLAGGPEVVRLRLSAESKSRLGYALQAAAEGGRLRLYAADGSPEQREARRQLELARAAYLPSRLLRFDLAPRDGHDDYLCSLALAVEAAAGSPPLTAVGRPPEPLPAWGAGGAA